MAEKGQKNVGNGKSQNGNASVDSNAQGHAPSPIDSSEFAAAKAAYDAKRKALAEIKAKIRRAKMLAEKGDDREAKLKEAIERAKVGSAKTKDELLAKAEEFEKEMRTLLKESKQVLAVGEVKQEKLDLLRQELAEIRAAKKAERKTGTGEGGTQRTGSVAAAKAALVKALARRGWVIRYDSDEAAVSAVKEDDKGKALATLTFTSENWTSKVGDVTAEHPYGAGAVQIADGLIEPPKEKGKAGKEKAA